jgi:hypothetical protein
MTPKTKYRGEFGSSPSLLDDGIRDPELARQLYNAIPDLANREADAVRYVGDLAKVNGVVHMWNGERWVNQHDA